MSEPGRTPISSVQLPDTIEPGAEMRILYVDDDAINRRVVREMLSLIGASMDEAPSGALGLALLEAGDYDLILMDLRMPIMDGLEATRRIRARTDHKGRLPVVIVTADSGADLRRRCAASGADEVIQKPLSMETFFEIVRRLSSTRPEA